MKRHILSLAFACMIGIPKKAFGDGDYGTLATNVANAATMIEIPGNSSINGNITTVTNLLTSIEALDSTTTIPVGDLENIVTNLARFRGINDTIATRVDTDITTLKALIATLLANAATARAGNKGASAPE